MRLEYTATANCSIEQASAYFNDLAAYCKVHTLKGTEFTVLNGLGTGTIVLEKRSIGKISWQSTHQVKSNFYKTEDEIIDGEGKGTKQTIQVNSVIQPTRIRYFLEPTFTTFVSKAMFKALGEQKAQKMMLEALKKSAQLDIDYLNKAGKTNA